MFPLRLRRQNQTLGENCSQAWKACPEDCMRSEWRFRVWRFESGVLVSVARKRSHRASCTRVSMGFAARRGTVKGCCEEGDRRKCEHCVVYDGSAGGASVSSCEGNWEKREATRSILQSYGSFDWADN